jgi:hypothetical protein
VRCRRNGLEGVFRKRRKENSYVQQQVCRHQNLKVDRVEKRRIYCGEGSWAKLKVANPRQTHKSIPFQN